jgi:hypothetical protein
LAHAKPQACAPENGCDNNVTKSANVKSPIQIRDEKKEVCVRERERVNNNLNPQLPSQLQSRSISCSTNPQM